MEAPTDVLDEIVDNAKLNLSAGLWNLILWHGLLPAEIVRRRRKIYTPFFLRDLLDRCLNYPEEWCSLEDFRVAIQETEAAAIA